MEIGEVMFMIRGHIWRSCIFQKDSSEYFEKNRSKNLNSVFDADRWRIALEIFRDLPLKERMKIGRVMVMAGSHIWVSGIFEDPLHQKNFEKIRSRNLFLNFDADLWRINLKIFWDIPLKDWIKIGKNMNLGVGQVSPPHTCPHFQSSHPRKIDKKSKNIFCFILLTQIGGESI